MANNKNSKKGGGVLGGLLLLIAGIGLLWYNEGRTVKNHRAYMEAKKVYVDVKNDKIDKDKDGKLVSTNGKFSLSETTELKDEKFGISSKSAKMLRNVEMYQWEEECKTDEDDHETCTYEKVWKDAVINSSDFKKAGHENPSEMKYDSETYYADNVKLGAFVLPEGLLKKLDYNKKVDEEVLKANYNNSVETLQVSGKYITNVKDDTPQIGDVRISYEYLTEENVSILAVQTDNTFQAFSAKNGKTIFEIQTGNKTGAQIIDGLIKGNNTMKWILRAVGILLEIFAFSTMFSFLTNLTDRIPILGRIVSGATGLISFVLGLAVSLVVIAIAWFRFRPVLSIILIVIVAALIVCLKVLPKKDKEVPAKD